MKKVIFILFVFVFSFESFSQQENYHEVIGAAESDMRKYLNSIPEGMEHLYGFSSRDELDLASIGRAYQVVTLHEDFFSKESLNDRNDYLTLANEWQVTIEIAGRGRAFLIVANMNGIWKTVGLGAAAMANDIGFIEKDLPNKNLYGQILRVYQLKADFLLSGDTSDPESILAFPLQSAINALHIEKAAPEPLCMKELLMVVDHMINHK